MDNRAEGYPFIASSGPAVLTCVPGQVAQMSLALQNLYARVPMQIEELRFLVSSWQGYLIGHGGAATFLPIPTPGAYVKAQIFGGPYGLTAGFVPISVLGQRVSEATEFALGQAATGNIVSTRIAQSRSNWKFDHPLPLGTNELIQMTFQYFNPGAEAGAPWLTYGSGTTMSIYVSAVGRTLDELPKKCWAPYASGYVGLNNTPYSQENDLRNMLNRDLQVRRLVGRAYRYGYSSSAGGGVAAATGAWAEYTRAGQFPVPSPAFDQSQVAQFKLGWPDDANASQDFIGFTDAFPEQSLSFDANKIVPTGRAVSLQWGGNPGTYTVGVAGGTTTVQPVAPNLIGAGFMPMIGMIGEREEERA